MNKLFKPRFLLGIAFAIAFFAGAGMSQTACPADKVCISPESMKFFLGQDDKAKALEAENKVLKESIHKFEVDIIPDLKVGLAKATGELTGCQQSNIDLRAMNTSLVQGYKARNKFGVINF